jgi:hypothetical protein
LLKKTLCLRHNYMISFLWNQMQAYLRLLFISFAPYVLLEFEILKGFNFNNHQ